MFPQKTSLKNLRAYVAYILSQAFLDLFPQGEVIKASLTDTRFFLNIRVEGSLHPLFLTLLQEKMRGLFKEDKEIELIEMTKSAAVHYFEHFEQFEKASRVEEMESPLIPMARQGSFCDIYEAPPQKASWGDFVFALFEVEPKGEEGEFEIEGSAFFEKEDLKAFTVQRKAWLKEKPWKAAEHLGWMAFTETHPLLLPEGLQLAKQLENLWRTQLARSSLPLLEVEGGELASYFQLFTEKGVGCIEWGAVKSSWGPSDRGVLFAGTREASRASISPLQFISEIFKLLSLDISWILSAHKPAALETKQWKQEVKYLTQALQELKFDYQTEAASEAQNHPMIELRLTDALGETWIGPFLSVNLSFISPVASVKHQSMAAIEFSLLGPLKRLISLLAEKREKTGESVIP